MKKKVDYLIVGQGLAGTFLAFQLLRSNKTFLVIDQGHETSSSYIAAGIINPLVLKRLTVTWRAEEFLNYNGQFYAELEEFLNDKYHFEMPIHQLIQNEEAEEFWQHRFEKANLEKYIYEDLRPIDASYLPAKDFKIGKVNQTSWLNISKLLTDFRAFLNKRELIISESFDYSMLEANQYEDVAFEKIVFCEGSAAVKNPYFNHLPFSLNKGQLITIESNSLPTDVILKKKVFLLPTEDQQFKAGATYSWKWKDEETEEEKTSILQEQLEEMTEANYTILRADTGIRPAVKDRRPLLGIHSKYRSFCIFNGMGSRGCFMAPLLAAEFLSFLIEGKVLNQECDIARFDKK